MIVDMAVYEHGVRRPGELKLDQVYEACRIDGSFAWIGLSQPTEAELDSVAREFNLHELALEDVHKGHQRPKLDVYGDSIFMVLKPAHYDDDLESVETGEIQIIVGDGFVITVRHDETSLHDVRLRLEQRPDLMGFGPGAVLYSVIDKVVDDYVPVLEALDVDIREVEADVFSEARSNPAERIYKLRREVLEVYAAVTPLEDPLDRLSRGDITLVAKELEPYFEDVRDHVVKGMRAIEGFRELLTSVLAANLTQISVRQNDDVRKISAWAAIIAVPTLITGIYGMNFEHMPELGWRFGYPLALSAMGVLCLFLFRGFKRRGWL